ncbi:MAG: folate-binding protein [Azoarcus sp.]|jgi:folate-binding protein YgfZ|nr:folate-binding protein [Azoarcus sp.]
MNDWIDHLIRNGADISAGGASAAFGGPHADTGALARGAAAIPLRHLGLIHATGSEAAPFLHNLLSNDINTLAADAAQWTSFNSAQGRMLANFLLWRDSDGGGDSGNDSGGNGNDGNRYSLALAADLAPALLKKLSFYILRAKVKLTLPAPERALIGLAGPAAGNCLTHAALPSPAVDMRHTAAAGVRVIRINTGLYILELAATAAPATFAALCAAGAAASGVASWELAAIRAGLPLVTAATQETFVAQMLNYEIIGGISFTKGCYPGQEIIARTQYLGKPKRRTYRLALSALPATGAPPGTALYAPASGERPVGIIVNTAPLPEGGEALAVIQTAHAGDELHIGAPGGPCAHVLELPYEIRHQESGIRDRIQPETGESVVPTGAQRR